METKNNASLLMSLIAYQAIQGCHQEEIIRGQWDSNDFLQFFDWFYIEEPLPINESNQVFWKADRYFAGEESSTLNCLYLFNLFIFTKRIVVSA